MPLAREFKETVMLRAKEDPDFRQELIVEATNAFLDGDIETGKRLPRDYLNATEALPSIARELKQNEKSIRRMVGPKGNPTLKNLTNLLNACKRRESIELHVCR
jgi:DNA-binding phage protein